MIVHDVRFTPASREDKVAGLIGFVSVVLGLVRIDGLIVRRTREGRYALSYPERRDGSGRAHPIVRPLTAAAREEINQAVLHELHRRAFIVVPHYSQEGAHES